MPDLHICPPWIAALIDNRLRRLIHDPAKIAGPYLNQGDTALDLGCGYGFMSLGMARLVGPTGCVYAADLQKRMLDTVDRRAEKTGVSEIVRTHQCSEDAIGLTSQVDLAIASWMLHEVPDPARTLRELGTIVKPEGRLLVIEPKGPVSPKLLETYTSAAHEAGFEELQAPGVPWSMALLWRRRASD